MFWSLPGHEIHENEINDLFQSSFGARFRFLNAQPSTTSSQEAYYDGPLPSGSWGGCHQVYLEWEHEGELLSVNGNVAVVSNKE